MKKVFCTGSIAVVLVALMYGIYRISLIEVSLWWVLPFQRFSDRPLYPLYYVVLADVGPIMLVFGGATGIISASSAICNRLNARFRGAK